MAVPLALLALFALCCPALAQTTISALSFSPSDTTIVATWTTSTACDSNLYVGGKAAIDNGFQTGVTSHQAIVTGLTPSTAYSAYVTSCGTSSTTQNVTTAAGRVRIPIIGATNGSSAIGNIKADTLYTFVSNDGLTYMVSDDTYASSGSPVAANLQIGKLTNETNFTYSQINPLTAYGSLGNQDGTDGPGGQGLWNKQTGLLGMMGNLYMFVHRDFYPSSTYPGQPIYYGNVIKSTNHGATWNNWLNPTTYYANGIEPPVTGTSKGQYQYTTATYGWAAPIRYAADDGTIGYLTAGNRIDGADGFVYASYTYQQYNANAVYLMRIPRVKLDAMSTTAWTYWVGPTSPSPSDFVNDSNWSSSSASATAIYSAANGVSYPNIEFVPGLNYYMLLTHVMSGLPSNLTDSYWTFLAGPTPAGPWHTFYTQHNRSTDPCPAAPGIACAYYGIAAMHRDLISNTATQNIPIRILYSGNFTYGSPQPAYNLTYSTLTLITGGAGVSGAGMYGAGLR